jgi:hypothetical protein
MQYNYNCTIPLHFTALPVFISLLQHLTESLSEQCVSTVMQSLLGKVYCIFPTQASALF